MKHWGLLFLSLTCWLSVPAQSLLQRSINWLEQDHRLLPLPIVYRSPETSWAAGGSLGYYFHTGDSSSTSNLQLQAVYTMRQQLITRFSGEVFGPNNRYYAYGYLSYRQYVDRYYGIGPLTTLNDREDFSYRSWEGWGGWLWSVRPNLYAGLQFRHQLMYDMDYVQSGALANGLVNGSAGSTTTGFGPELFYDTRDKVQSPRRGWRMQAAWRLHPAWYAGTSAFRFGQVDLRHYHPVQPKITWAKRLLYRQADGAAPFRELALAGGSEFARGYFEGRFRDNSLLGLENEFRWQFHRRFSWNFFASGFQVGNRPNQLFQNPWQYAYGTGLRIFVNPEERVALRIDVARTAERQLAFYLDLSEAF